MSKSFNLIYIFLIFYWYVAPLNTRPIIHNTRTMCKAKHANESNPKWSASVPRECNILWMFNIWSIFTVQIYKYHLSVPSLSFRLQACARARFQSRTMPHLQYMLELVVIITVYTIVIHCYLNGPMVHTASNACVVYGIEHGCLLQTQKINKLQFLHILFFLPSAQFYLVQPTTRVILRCSSCAVCAQLIWG